MPRAYWKGYLRLSLVCPIELFPAATQAEKTIFIRSTLALAIGYASKWSTNRPDAEVSGMLFRRSKPFCN